MPVGACSAPGSLPIALSLILRCSKDAPDMQARAITIYEGGGGLMQLARSKDQWHRALYGRLAGALRPP